MGRPTKEEVKAKEEAKKRVDELLGDDFDIDIKKAPAVAEKLDQLVTSGGGNKWLEDQIKNLTEENKRLETELVTAKEDYKKLFEQTSNGQSSAPIDPSDVEKGVMKIFKELRDNYEGNNPTRTKYVDVKIRHLLENFLKNFVFLRKK